MALESNYPRFNPDRIIYQSDTGMKFESRELTSASVNKIYYHSPHRL